MKFQKFFIAIILSIFSSISFSKVSNARSKLGVEFPNVFTPSSFKVNFYEIGLIDENNNKLSIFENTNGVEIDLTKPNSATQLSKNVSPKIDGTYTKTYTKIFFITSNATKITGNFSSNDKTCYTKSGNFEHENMIWEGVTTQKVGVQNTLYDGYKAGTTQINNFGEANLIRNSMYWDPCCDGTGIGIKGPAEVAPDVIVNGHDITENMVLHLAIKNSPFEIATTTPNIMTHLGPLKNPVEISSSSIGTVQVSFDMNNSFAFSDDCLEITSATPKLMLSIKKEN